MHPYVLDALARDRMQQAAGRSAAHRIAGPTVFHLAWWKRLRTRFTRSTPPSAPAPSAAPAPPLRRARPGVPAARPRSVRPQPRRVAPHATRVTRECRRVFG
jgi:hypothetical protein